MSITRTNYRMNTIGATFFILLVVSGVGCKFHAVDAATDNPQGDYGTYNIASYMPLAIGNRWIYDSRGNEIAVLDRRIKDSVLYSTDLYMFAYTEEVLVNLPSGIQAVSGCYGHRGGTIYFASARGTTGFGPLQPLLTSPIVVGHRWHTNLQAIQDTFQVISVESGNFNGQAIDTIAVVRYSSGVYIDTTWYGRAVGIVKKVSYYNDGTGPRIRQLRSFSPAP